MMDNSKKTFSKSEILEMAKELGLALASSESLARYRVAESKVAADPHACYLTRIFKEKHKKLVSLTNRKDADKSEIDKCMMELEEADRNMKGYPLINEYYKRGAEFNNLLYQINQLLRFYSMDEDEGSQFDGVSMCRCCSEKE